MSSAPDDRRRFDEEALRRGAVGEAHRADRERRGHAGDESRRRPPAQAPRPPPRSRARGRRSTRRSPGARRSARQREEPIVGRRRTARRKRAPRASNSRVERQAGKMRADDGEFDLPPLARSRALRRHRRAAALRRPERHARWRDAGARRADAMQRVPPAGAISVTPAGRPSVRKRPGTARAQRSRRFTKFV